MGRVGAERFLVTGATGFVGANLCRRLVERERDVVALVRPGSDRWRLEGLAGSLTIAEADLLDPSGVADAVRSADPTVLCHLAAHGAYPHQSDMSRVTLTNVNGLVHLLAACEGSRCRLFVNTGSSSEYGRKQFAMRETDTLEPTSYYAVAKAAQTLLCQAATRTSAFPLVTLRLFSVYGPYEEPGRLLPNLLRAALRDEVIHMADPATSRDFIHVDDVVDLYLMVDQLRGLPGEILNVGTGLQTSLETLVATVAEVRGRPVLARWGSMGARPWDASTWMADTSKARQLLAWQAPTSLRRGVERGLEWFAAHPEPYDQRGAAQC
jgi:nucleoside-diphosphate-sugar epimerase